MKLSKEMNSWLMVLVVLATAGITSWVMLKDNPSLNTNTPYYYPPQQVAQHLSPVLAAVDKGWFLVANAQGIPPVIRAGAVPPHADRGVCASCHTVVSSRGNTIPNITASSTMEHEYRGVCSNCHILEIKNRPGTNAVNVPAGSVQVAMTTPQGAMGLGGAPGAIVPSMIPAEGEWMGLEVAPITPLTAVQYGIPYGTKGLVVAGADARAAIAGLKAGDVVLSVNNRPISNMTDFLQATWGGALPQGVLDVIRKGQRLTVNFSRTGNAVAVVVPNAPGNALAGGVPVVMVTPQGVVGQGVAPGATARVKPPAEGEWMGLEVARITQITATQYAIPAGTQGLVLLEAEAEAALAGLKGGDVVLSINGAPVTNLTDFFRVTRNGNLTQAVVGVLRKGQILAVNVPQKPNPAQVVVVPNAPVNTLAGGVAVVQPTPQGGIVVNQGNVAGWGGGQGFGNAQGWNSPATGSPKQL